MHLHREKERFAAITETDLDKAMLMALMGTLPYVATGGHIYFQLEYYQVVLNFITDVEEKFDEALYDLSQEVCDEV